MVTQLDLEALYDREHGRIYASLRRFGVSPIDAEDALHEVFIIAHRRWPTLREAASAHAWLVGIARNVARHYHRGRARRRRALAEMTAQPDVAPDGRDLLDRVMAARYLERFLSGLEAGPREAFVLVELEQLRGRELAEAIGISEAAAWSRLRRARRAFERHFARHDPQLVHDADARASFLSRADPANVGAVEAAAAARIRSLLPVVPLAASKPATAAAGGGFQAWTASVVQGMAGFAGTIVGVGGVGLWLAGAAPSTVGEPPRRAATDDVSDSEAPVRRVASERASAVGEAAVFVSPPPATRPTAARAPSSATTERPVPVQRSRVLADLARERQMAEDIETLVRAGRDESAERATIAYFDEFPSGRFEARVRALRVAIFCRQGKVAMAATERRLFSAAAPDEAQRRAPWLACEAIDARASRQRAERARLEAEFDEL